VPAPGQEVSGFSDSITRLFGPALPDFGGDRSRSDRVHPDPVPVEFRRRTSGEHLYAALRRRVVSEWFTLRVRLSSTTCSRSFLDAAIDHVLGRQLGAEERALEVDAVDEIEVLRGDVEELGAAVDARVISPSVGSTELAGRLDHRLDLRRVGKRQSQRTRQVPPRSSIASWWEPRRRGLSAPPDVGVDHCRSRVAESVCDRAADTARCSRDHGRLTG